MNHEHLISNTGRCTTCGGFLPCALHDREFKNVLFMPRERNFRRIHLEKIQENLSRRYTQIERLDDSTYLCSGLQECPAPVSILTLHQENRDVWLFEDQQTDVLVDGGPTVGIGDLYATTLTRTSNGDLLNLDCYNSYLQRLKNIDGRWKSLDEPVALNFSEVTEHGFKRFVSLGNDVFLLAADTIACPAFQLGSVYRLVRVSPSGEVSLDTITDQNGHALDEGSSFISDIVPLADGSLLVAKTDFDMEGDKDGLYRLIPPLDRSARGWRFERLRAVDGSPIQFVKTSLKIERLSERQCIVGTGGRELIVLEAGDDYQEWRARVINEDQVPNLFRDGMEPVSLAAFSERCFIAAWSDGELELWQRSMTGKWDCVALDLGYVPEFEYGVRHITPVSADPLVFFLSDASGTSYWRINAHEMSAIHERKAEQQQPQPMPDDIAYDFSNDYANAA